LDNQSVIYTDGTFTNEIQARIYSRLNQLVSTDIAEFYKDACRILYAQERLSTTTHLVTHLLREVESTFLDILVYTSGRSEEVASRPNSSDELVQETEGGGSQKQKRQIALNFLGIGEEETIARFWLKLELHRKAHRSAQTFRRLDDEFWEFWTQLEQLFDGLLVKFEENYLYAHNIFDNLARLENPTNSHLSILRNRLPNNQIGLTHFFNNASVEWLALSEFRKVFFKNPAEQVNGYIRPWAESKYLLRCISKYPDWVFEITLEIPAVNNSYILEDICDIACSLPIDKTIALVPSVISHLRIVNSIFNESTRSLISYLIENNHWAEAKTILEILLEIIPPEEEKDENPFRRSEPKTRINNWNYEQTLEEVVPKALEHKFFDIFRLLVELLDNALAISHPYKDGSDYSYWREVIPNANHEEVRNLEDVLVTCIYNAAVNLFTQKGVFKEVLNIISSSKRAITQRIILQILTVFPAVDPAISTNYLVNHINFSAWSPEYFTALSICFPQLQNEDQWRILSWIEQLVDETLSPSEIRHAKYDQAQALTYIHDSLPDLWRARYEELTHLFTDITPVQPAFSVTTFTNLSTSPLNVEEIKNKPIEELVAFLNTWVPPDSFMGPSPEGLGRVLTSDISQRPEEYAPHASRFKGLHPTYIRSMVDGFADACRASKSFEWDKVLDLCFWVVQQPNIPTDTYANHEDRDPDWSWTRSQIARLLEVAFIKDALHFSYRTIALQVIEFLTQDPDPTPETDRRYLEKDNSSALNGSLNTVRGKAFHALIRYAFWCQRNLDQLSSENEGFDYFTLMPEVKFILEDHLVNDPSHIIRSIYGQYFAGIHYVDKSWATGNLDLIFPTDGQNDVFFDAAWSSFLSTGRVFTEVFHPLKEKYLYATQRLNYLAKDTIPTQDISYRLSEHIIILYWSGFLELNDEILDTFFNLASDNLRANIIRFSGHYIKDLTNSQIEKLKDFWALRLVQANDNPQTHKVEMAAFGWWVISGSNLEVSWQFEQLLGALNINPKIDVSFRVLQWIKENIPDQILLGAKCLDLIVFNAKSWDVEHAQEEVKAAILSVARSGNSEAKKVLRILINKLAARSDMRFKDLLRELDE
jgi:hypothetical protein